MKTGSKPYVLSKGLDRFFAHVYKAYAFVARFFKELFKPPFHIREVVNQSYEIGLKSLALISAGKVGSSIGAELSSMKVTEQIEAMEVSAINPFKYLVVTRVLATTITIPILSLYCIFVGLLGSYINVRAEEATGIISFYTEAFSSVSFLDLYTSLTKSIAYGFTIGMVGCYKGFNASNGTRGVGRAANQSVVLAMFLIFLEEVVIVQVSNWIRLY